MECNRDFARTANQWRIVAPLSVDQQSPQEDNRHLGPAASISLADANREGIFSFPCN
jgi:hypothetical protein